MYQFCLLTLFIVFFCTCFCFLILDVMSQEDLDACLREVKMLDDVCDHPNIM